MYFVQMSQRYVSNALKMMHLELEMDLIADEDSKSITSGWSRISLSRSAIPKAVGGVLTYYLDKFPPKNCMKLKKIDPSGRVPVPPPPL